MWDQHAACVFFIWLGYDPGLSSVIIFFFFFCVWYVSQPVFLFHISSAVSHISLLLVALFLLSAAISLHPSSLALLLYLVIISCGCSYFPFSKLHFHNYHSFFYAPISPDLPLSLSTCFHFQTPTSALHYIFCQQFLVSVLPPSTRCSITSLSLPLLSLSSSLYIFLLSSVSLWAVMIICW